MSTVPPACVPSARYTVSLIVVKAGPAACNSLAPITAATTKTTACSAVLLLISPPKLLSTLVILSKTISSRSERIAASKDPYPSPNLSATVEERPFRAASAVPNASGLQPRDVSVVKRICVLQIPTPTKKASFNKKAALPERHSHTSLHFQHPLIPSGTLSNPSSPLSSQAQSRDVAFPPCPSVSSVVEAFLCALSATSATFAVKIFSPGLTDG